MIGLVALVALVAMSDYKLVWSEEFDRDGAPDPAKWGYEVGYVRNNEAQYYFADRRENARVEGGRLILEARKDGFEGKPISSASITTQGKASWTYGKIEARVKVPRGRGTWPAFWTLGTNITEVNWPRCGEIDIMEYVGYDADGAHFNLHYPDEKGEHVGKGARVEMKNLADDFHVWGVEWSAEEIAWQLDGKETMRIKKADLPTWVFDQPQYVILNLAIGGAWGGQQGVDDAIFPARYEVDWVRVWQKD